MGNLLSDSSVINRDFIASRMGHQMTGNNNRDRGSQKSRKTFGQRVGRLVSDLRKQVAMLAVTVLDGKTGRDAYREGRFRQNGEIHRWMYDRVSLAQVLSDLGFENPTVCTADESAMDGFDSYQLDRDGDLPRKPDSLYMEACKPALASPSSMTTAKAA